MDTYCLVVDPGQHLAYGGVLECELSDIRLRLLLAGDTARDLGLPEETSFTLALSRDQLALVGRGLTKVLTSGRPNAMPQTLDLHPRPGRPGRPHAVTASHGHQQTAARLSRRPVARGLPPSSVGD